MLKKKIEVVELDKKEEKIVLEEKQSSFILFLKKHSLLIFITALIISFTVLIVSLFITLSNLSTSDNPTIKEVSIDTDLADAYILIDPSAPLTEETAKNVFEKNNSFKQNGEVLLVKVVETSQYTIKFFSDYTAIKIMKNTSLITRINSLDDNTYGISENAVINSKAITLDITKTDTKEYKWGTVNYYSDGSAEIINSKIDMFVRNSKEISENYISNNKVSYIKETKNIGNIKLNYYYDGTIEVIKDSISYLVRDINDLKISNNNVLFKNNNEATIKETIKLSDGKTIDYYTDGGAIIHVGSRTLSVRKSNSIIIKNNKIFEIVDNIYVTVSNTKNNGNVIYYTNGSAVIKNKAGKTLYIPENSNIKYQNKKISDIGNNYEQLVEERNINNDKILKFATTAVVETKDYIAIVPKNNILYNPDGSLKEIIDNDVEANTKPIKITNNTNKTIKYRLVIEKSNKTNLDVEYIKYQLSVKDTYLEPAKLNANIWNKDELTDIMSVKGTNYILLDKTLEPHNTDEIKLMLWTDYDTIPNSMQDKYFYGTIRIYAWQELN